MTTYSSFFLVIATLVSCVGPDYDAEPSEVSSTEIGATSAAATSFEERIGRMSRSCSEPPSADVISVLLRNPHYEFVIVDSLTFGERRPFEVVTDIGVHTVEHQHVFLEGEPLLSGTVTQAVLFAIQDTEVFQDIRGTVFHVDPCPEAGDPLGQGSLFSRLRASEGLGIVVIVQHTPVGDLLRNVMPWDGERLALRNDVLLDRADLVRLRDAAPRVATPTTEPSE